MLNDETLVIRLKITHLLNKPRRLHNLEHHSAWKPLEAATTVDLFFWKSLARVLCIIRQINDKNEKEALPSWFNDLWIQPGTWVWRSGMSLLVKTFRSGFSCLFNMPQAVPQASHYRFSTGKSHMSTSFLVLLSPSFPAHGTPSINNQGKMLLFLFTGPSSPRWALRML